MKLIKLKLFSPIIVKGEAPYENPWDNTEDFRPLTEFEKRKCRAEIYEAVSRMLSPTVPPHSFERRIYSAVPAVEEKDGRTMLVLNCECYRILSESELDDLCDWWENKIIEAHERLHKEQIKTKRLGRIFIHLWFMKNWAIEPIFQ